VLSAGVRHSRLKVKVDDFYLSNGDDSGGAEYRESTPVAGVLYKVSPVMNVYASAARGFETPTLNELFYSPSGAGFNFGLRPASSKHAEVGVKAIVGANTRVNAALFQVRTEDELVVDTSGGGRTSYRNASETLRRGAELSAETSFGAGWSARMALTALRATYETGFGSVAAGSSLPGIPRANLFGELAWTDKSDRFGAALEAIASKKFYTEDTNTETPAPGYGVLNARVQAKQSAGRWKVREFVRLNNVLDRDYVGSVIVGDANKRYYEAAPGRTWLIGVSAQYQF
jgi:iron complex outermembrane receptor protein